MKQIECYWKRDTRYNVLSQLGQSEKLDCRRYRRISAPMRTLGV
jgi:hypothetical protein